MNRIHEDLEQAKHLIEDASILSSLSNYSNFKRIYPFTNENINGAFQNININKQACLTVLGSSDQSFDLVLKGPSKITTFDRNPLEKHYGNLKKAALDADLSFEDYLKYFISNGLDDLSNKNLEVFNRKIFDKLIKYLPKDSFYLWTNLYELYHPRDIRNSLGLFLHDEYQLNALLQIINYLNFENYSILKKMIKEVEFNHINCNIKDLPTLLTEMYSLIYLSNILQYYDTIFQNKNKLDSMLEFQELINKLDKYLKEDGRMIIGYLYNIEDESITYKLTRNHVFRDSKYQTRLFRSAPDIEIESLFGVELFHHDAILSYKKSR